MSKTLKIAAVALLASLGLAACGSDGPPNKDPRHGWVSVDDNYAYKKCDGPNLVYEIGRAGSVVPNSQECQP